MPTPYTIRINFHPGGLTIEALNLITLQGAVIKAHLTYSLEMRDLAEHIMMLDRQPLLERMN